MGLASFFSNIFGNNSSSWNGTPESFLALVLFFQKKNNPSYSEQEVLQWGAILQKVFKVNLSPYTDFKDLLQRGEPDFSTVRQIEDQIEERRHRVELKKAIYGDDVDLGDDDVMNSDSESAVFARKFVDDMSKYVRFREDEEQENKKKP